MRKASGKLAFVAIALSVAGTFGASADEVMVKGEIIKIDVDAGSITIKHEAIKKYDMDGMTMVFKAGDPAMLKRVKPGDKITFHPDKVNGQFTVTKIEMPKK